MQDTGQDIEVKQLTKTQIKAESGVKPPDLVRVKNLEPGYNFAKSVGHETKNHAASGESVKTTESGIGEVRRELESAVGKAISRVENRHDNVDIKAEEIRALENVEAKKIDRYVESAVNVEGYNRVQRGGDVDFDAGGKQDEREQGNVGQENLADSNLRSESGKIKAARRFFNSPFGKPLRRGAFLVGLGLMQACTTMDAIEIARRAGTESIRAASSDAQAENNIELRFREKGVNDELRELQNLRRNSTTYKNEYRRLFKMRQYSKDEFNRREYNRQAREAGYPQEWNANYWEYRLGALKEIFGIREDGIQDREMSSGEIRDAIRRNQHDRQDVNTDNRFIRIFENLGTNTLNSAARWLRNKAR